MAWRRLVAVGVVSVAICGVGATRSAKASVFAKAPADKLAERPRSAEARCRTKALAGRSVVAQSPTFGLGRPARPDDLAAIDIDVAPDGHGLPPGRGTAADGKQIYAARCVTCHGATGREGPQDILVGGQGSLNGPKPLKTVGSYWPYATTVWDYVRRAMPFDHPGTLPADDVYSVTAYLLYLNGIVGEHDVIDQATLPQVQMPNRAGFAADPRPDTGLRKKK